MFYVLSNSVIVGNFCRSFVLQCIFMSPPSPQFFGNFGGIFVWRGIFTSPPTQQFSAILSEFLFFTLFLCPLQLHFVLGTLRAFFCYAFAHLLDSYLSIFSPRPFLELY